MAVVIRLMRFGKKGFPFYRIVAIDKRKKRDGSYLERVGDYDPCTDPATINVDKQIFDKWVFKGAKPSSGLRRLLKIKTA